MGDYFFMRIITELFETVTEVTLPCFAKHKSKSMYSVLIKSPPFIGSANRHRSPCRTPHVSGISFYDTIRQKSRAQTKKIKE